MWEIVYIGVIMGEIEQGIWLLSGNSCSITEGNPQSTLLIQPFKWFLETLETNTIVNCY